MAHPWPAWVQTMKAAVMQADGQVGVVEDDERRFAAELEKDPLHRAGGGGHDLPTGSVEPVNLTWSIRPSVASGPRDRATDEVTMFTTPARNIRLLYDQPSEHR